MRIIISNVDCCRDRI